MNNTSSISPTLMDYLEKLNTKNSNNPDTQHKLDAPFTEEQNFSRGSLSHNSISQVNVESGYNQSNRGSVKSSTSSEQTRTNLASSPKMEEFTAKSTDTNIRQNNNRLSTLTNEGNQALFEDWPTAEPPLVVNKPSLQNVVFKQPVSIRFLKPPTPPPPGPIVIRERRAVPPPPLPPQVIRQKLPRVRTPEPLVIRERPPTPPKLAKPLLIEKHLPAPPRPPRQVIIERFTEPRRPRKVVFEKWLKYKAPKRKIILEKAPEIPIAPPPRNIIIEYSSPLAVSLPEYNIEGVFVADPLTYTYSPHVGELKVVDKIYDLPPLPTTKGSFSANAARSRINP